MAKPTVYIASPYTKGDPCVNARFQMRMFDEMINDGIVTPIAPLWSHFQHTAFPRPYTDWIRYDQEIIERCCDAVLRLNVYDSRMDYEEEYYISESSGADGEVALAGRLGLEVFYSLEQVYEWAKEWCKKCDHSSQE